jgi:F-type H+-transporting ATPase subunit epsilon
MQIEIITPDAKLFEGEVNSVKLPGSSGEFEILNNHASIVSNLTSGNICISKKDGENQIYKINGGVVEMKNNKIIILAD